jgi:DNA polymerase I-like protein with 3'-5' exonuclease and polymerase domains
MRLISSQSVIEDKLPEGFFVMDLECTTQPDKIKAVDGNSVYMIGIEGKHQDGTYSADVWGGPVDDIYSMPPFKALVGHNLKYDLEYVRRSNIFYVYEAKGGKWAKTPMYDYIRRQAIVLDTQFITYLHSGHTKTFCSLEEACEYWGVPHTKLFNLGDELLKVGHDITKIPNLEKYLQQDILLTKKLILKIMEDPWVQKNASWIVKMHDGYLGTQEIEFNGMHVDVSALLKLQTKVTKTLADARDALVRHTGLSCFDPSSNAHVGAYLFGGVIEEQERIPVGVYASGEKMGQPRYRIKRDTHTLPGIVPLSTQKSILKFGKSGKPSVDEDALLAVKRECTGMLLDPVGFVDTLLVYRESSKLLGTYLEGLNKHLRLHDGNYYVFPQINTCQTGTGRTSSSKPNMQNNPTHDSVGVASIYTSRFGKDAGVLIEVDFKQIEVVALATLSQDRQLIDDILKGRDIHAETGKPVFGSKMTKEQRRIVKTINFGLIYGGGGATLAAQAGVSLGTATKAIRSFYGRYPRVREYFSDFMVSIEDSCARSGCLTGQTLPSGFAQKAYLWESSTGRRYSFKTYFDPARQIEPSYRLGRSMAKGLAKVRRRC